MENKSKYFKEIINNYKKNNRHTVDTHLEYCRIQKNLRNTIEVAAKSINKQNKIHSHQRRIGRLKLVNFSEILKKKEAVIAKVKNFDSLIKIIENVRIPGIGELTIYDVAHRIGLYLGILPDKIYLHAGTRIGAKNLLGKLNSNYALYISELPEEFQNSGLTAAELEDLFCHFREYFNEAKDTNHRNSGCLN